MTAPERNLFDLLDELKTTPFNQRRRWLNDLQPLERQLIKGWVILSVEPILQLVPDYLERLQAFGERIMDGVAAGLERKGG